MGVFIKRNHGVEYVYVLVGRAHYFIGRKDEPESANVENLYKAMDALSSSFDQTLAKHVDDLRTCMTYMPKDESSKYLRQRRSELDKILDQLNEVGMQFQK